MTCILVKSNRLQSRRKFAQFMHRPPLGMYSGISHLPPPAETPAFPLVISIPSITFYRLLKFTFVAPVRTRVIHRPLDKIPRLQTFCKPLHFRTFRGFKVGMGAVQASFTHDDSPSRNSKSRRHPPSRGRQYACQPPAQSLPHPSLKSKPWASGSDTAH